MKPSSCDEVSQSNSYINSLYAQAEDKTLLNPIQTNIKYDGKSIYKQHNAIFNVVLKIQKK